MSDIKCNLYEWAPLSNEKRNTGKIFHINKNEITDDEQIKQKIFALYGFTNYSNCFRVERINKEIELYYTLGKPIAELWWVVKENEEL